MLLGQSPPALRSIRILAGTGWLLPTPQPLPLRDAQLLHPHGVSVDARGRVYIADTGHNQIDEYNPATGQMRCVAGGGTQKPSAGWLAATRVRLRNPWSVAADGDGNIYVADSGAGLIEKVIIHTGQIKVIAGGGNAPVTGSPLPALSLALLAPEQVAVDRHGNVYFAVTVLGADASEILKLDTGLHTIVAIAGLGPLRAKHSPHQGNQIRLPGAVALAVAFNGDLYIADAEAGCVYRLKSRSGKLSIYAGGGKRMPGASPLRPRAARLNQPLAVAVDPPGNLYLLQSVPGQTGGLMMLLEVSRQDGKLHVVSGLGHRWPSLRPIAARAVALQAGALASDSFGTIYITDTQRSTVEVISSSAEQN